MLYKKQNDTRRKNNHALVVLTACAILLPLIILNLVPEDSGAPRALLATVGTLGVVLLIAVRFASHLRDDTDHHDRR